MVQRFISTNTRLRLVLLGGIAAAGLAVAWYLGSPLFLNRAVDESFPARQADASRAQVAAPAQAAPASAPPTAPVALSTGQFGVIDTIHKGEGSATLFTLPEGQRVLRLEDFKVTNGPDLFVYLSGHPAPRSGAELHQGAAFEVARLKGNIGNQNYELPPDLDLSQFKSVVIYCKQFSVMFSTAELVPAM